MKMLQLRLEEDHTSRNSLIFKVKSITRMKYATSHPLPNGSQQSQSSQDRRCPLIATITTEII